MELDVLKTKWAEHDRKLDLSIRLNRQVLMEMNRNRVRSPLRRFAVLVGLSALTGLAVAMLLGEFIYTHWFEPRFALAGVVLDVWVIANMAASLRLMLMAIEIDYGQPVAAIQKQLANLRIQRIRGLQWALLTGQLVWWIPFLIVGLKAWFGWDAYRMFSSTYLVVNLLFGLAVIPLGIWVSRQFGDRLGRSPFMQRVVRELAGYNLNEASRSLETLAKFESEAY